MSQIALRCSIGFSPVTHSYKYLLLLTSLLTRLLILVSFTEWPVTSTQAYLHKSHHLRSCTLKLILFSFLFSYVDKYILKPSFSFLSKVISSDTALLSPLTPFLSRDHFLIRDFRCSPPFSLCVLWKDHHLHFWWTHQPCCLLILQTRFQLSLRQHARAQSGSECPRAWCDCS